MASSDSAEGSGSVCLRPLQLLPGAGDRGAHLIGLQGPDQVELDIGIIGPEGGPLSLGLLDAVFAEHAVAAFEGGHV